MGRSWTRKKVRDAIIGLHRTAGKINSNFVQVHYPALYQAGMRYFGNWKAAVKAADFDYSVVRVRRPFRRWSKESIVAEIRRRQKKNLPLNGEIVSREDRGLYCAARRYFGKGGWRIALKEIGIDSRDIFPRLWTKSKIIAEIQALHEAGIPVYAYFLEQNGYARLTAGGRKCFGNWQNAIEAAGLKYDLVKAIRMRYWTRQRVLDEIRRLERRGFRLNQKATRQTRGDLFSTAVRLFGCWSNAVEAAGISYQEHCLIWSSKAWLRKLTPADVKILERKASTLSRQRRK